MLRNCISCGVKYNEKWEVVTDNAGKRYYKCPACGILHDIEETGSKKDREFDEKISEIQPLLQNLSFVEAEEKLQVLRNRYPDKAQVWFLSVLANNSISYIEDDRDTNRRIPTLNNISFSPLYEDEFVKKALFYSYGIEKEYYEETFDYIETKRQEIETDFKNGKHQYDIFISVKVSKLDEESQQVEYDEYGEAKKTRDYKIANELYELLSQEFPGYKIFFSEREKRNFVGQRYENYIFSALHTSKVFILVGESRFNLEWKWVKNEWKRYLNLMEPSMEGHENRNFVLVSKSLRPSDLPFEIKNREYININKIGSESNLLEFIRTRLNVNQVNKIKVQEFNTTINKKDLKLTDAVKIEKLVLNKNVSYAEQSVLEELNAHKYRIKNPTTRNDAIQKFNLFAMKHPDVYEVNMFKLLAGKNFKYNDFDEYFENLNNISNDSGFAKEYFSKAKEEDAIKYIGLTIDKISRLLDAKKEDNEIKSLPFVFDVVVKPYLSYFDKTIIENLMNKYEYALFRTKSDFLKNNHISYYLDHYLHLKQFLNDDANEYINNRIALFNRNLSWDYTNKIANEILKVDEHNVEALWVKLLINIFSNEWYQVYSLKRDYIAFTIFINNYVNSNKFFGRSFDSKKFEIVKNKTNIDIFKSLFDYAPKEEKSFFLYAMLYLIIHDTETYIYDDETNGKKSDNDYILSGIELFEKYIAYNLDETYFLKTNQVKVNDKAFDFKPFLDVNSYAYEFGEKKLRDSLILIFATRLQVGWAYNEAIKMYQLFLAQQDNLKNPDCLLARYYLELAKIECHEYESAKYKRKFINVESIIVDAINNQKNFPHSNIFIDSLEELTIYQSLIDQTCEKLDKSLQIDPKYPQSENDNIAQKIVEVRDYLSKVDHRIFNYVLDSYEDKIIELCNLVVLNYMDLGFEYNLDNEEKIKERITKIETFIKKMADKKVKFTYKMPKEVNEQFNILKNSIDLFDVVREKVSLINSFTGSQVYYKLYDKFEGNQEKINEELEKIKKYITKFDHADNKTANLKRIDDIYLAMSQIIDKKQKAELKEKRNKKNLPVLFAFIDTIVFLLMLLVIGGYIYNMVNFIVFESLFLYDYKINDTMESGGLIALIIVLISILWLVIYARKEKPAYLKKQVKYHTFIVEFVSIVDLVLSIFFATNILGCVIESGYDSCTDFMIGYAILLVLTLLLRTSSAKLMLSKASKYNSKNKYKRAFKYYKKAAIYGNYDLAYIQIGWYYEKGYYVSSNNFTANEWYLKAIDRGNAQAMHNYAYNIVNNIGVIKQDFKLAIELYKRATDLGHSGSPNNLALLYQNGTVTPKDLGKAIYYFNIAINRGNKKASNNLIKLQNTNTNWRSITPRP